MRITLVHPTGSNWIPGRRDITATANRMVPLGLLSMAAWLEKAGHSVQLLDCLGPDAPSGTDRQADTILSQRPELVGISATTSGFLDGYELARRIKARAPEVRTVFGGVHISAMGGVLLDRFAAIDCLCMGEGEQTLAELADGRPLKDIDGLIWRGIDGVIVNRPRDPIADLDDLPFPAYENLDGFPHKYNLPLFSYIRKPGATMVASRGCPYQCSYCDRSVFQRGYRYNSAGYVYAHLKYLRQRFGIRHVNIYDDLFTLHRKRIFDLCDRLAKKPLGMQFNCAVRVGYADDDLLDALKAAGCLMVSVGIETGDADMMDTHKPGVKIDAVRDTVGRLRKKGLRVKGLFMMGLPGETEASIEKTSDFVLSLGLDDMNMSKFTPFHGAPIWQRVHEEGVFTEDWRQMNCLNFVYIPAGIDSRETLDNLYNRHVKRFYTDRLWRKRFTKRLWQHRWSLWHLVRHLPTFIEAKRAFEPKPESN
ncbi:MAG: B12-binding domain-containing radical SAM protein [Deltaproteobacteria bacterium]|nr:MAG: B12-binding domain-containing radical SAM protein [Deltaproteobacteria bacterium]